MFPERIYYEEGIAEYSMGKKLMEKYKDSTWIPIQSHNNILELRSRPNEDFVEMKKYLIIGVRKTHKYVPNAKVSDFLVPFTSSGCIAMCLYCYLVCNYNKCSYLRVFVNHEQMLENLIKKSHSYEKECVFEIGSNSDLILENTVTGSLPYTIEEFAKRGRGSLTFPTKFSMVEELLPLNHQGKVIFRMSLNPQSLIETVEIGTSPLKNRIVALNKMCDAGYPIGILIAPVILVENWKKLYAELLDILEQELTPKAKSSLFIEVIFMTYSYVQNAINNQAFPNALKLYNKELMTGRGRGKYYYRDKYRADGEIFLRQEIEKRFQSTKIIYVV